MTSGNTFTYNEDRFILNNMDRLFPSDIAKELSSRFFTENRGHRSYRGVVERIKVLKNAGVNLNTLGEFRHAEEMEWKQRGRPKDVKMKKNKGGRPKKRVK